MLIELDKFKNKQKEPCFISWARGIVTTNDKNYTLQYVRIGDETYPYVNVPDKPSVKLESVFKQGKRLLIEFDEEKNNKINTIVTNKQKLKKCSYDVDKDEYYIIGIGDEAIKAYKNNSPKWKYFRYETNEGDRLLNKLYNAVGQITLTGE